MFDGQGWVGCKDWELVIWCRMLLEKEHTDWPHFFGFLLRKDHPSEVDEIRVEVYRLVGSMPFCVEIVINFHLSFEKKLHRYTTRFNQEGIGPSPYWCHDVTYRRPIDSWTQILGGNELVQASIRQTCTALLEPLTTSISAWVLLWSLSHGTLVLCPRTK